MIGRRSFYLLTMLQRYLGNKQSILPAITRVVSNFAGENEVVCDAFSGTLSVTMAFKGAGFRVASNDANFFSYVYGQALLIPSNLPTLDARKLVGETFYLAALPACQLIAASLVGKPGFGFLAQEELLKEYCEILVVARALQDFKISLIPEIYRGEYIFNTYAPGGRNSSFQSLRGSQGRRSFFSDSNAKRIDRALSILRYWWLEGIVDHHAHALLTSMLMDGIEKVSNTQGTYHDFPRNFTDRRSENDLTLPAPPLDDVLVGKRDHLLGCEEDSVEFVKRIPDGAVLYMDPPYNFRQYATYYFLPNVVCKYHLISDLEDYFSNVSHVRGQNMRDNFDSQFCRRKDFIPSLEELIVNSRARAVVLSYFDGRNHWNDHSNESGSEGLNQLKRFFKSSLFAKNTYKNYPLDRVNYQSYGGHKARVINEQLITAELK